MAVLREEDASEVLVAGQNSAVHVFISYHTISGYEQDRFEMWWFDMDHHVWIVHEVAVLASVVIESPPGVVSLSAAGEGEAVQHTTIAVILPVSMRSPLHPR